MVRTSPFHGGNRGSNPLGVTLTTPFISLLTKEGFFILNIFPILSPSKKRITSFIMDYKEYPEILGANDEYHSPPQKKAVFPSIGYYLKLVNILRRAFRKVKRGVYDRYNWVASSINVIHGLESVGVKFHITGMKNYQSFEGPAVFVGNHMSTLETMSMPALINPHKPVVFVIKKELTDYPVFGAIAKARHPIVVGRENPREDLRAVLEEGSGRLKEGRSVIIFPQRTRSIYFEPRSFNTLGVKLAKRSNVPVVPVAIVSDAWEPGSIIKDVGKIDPSKEVHIAFGEPMNIDGNGTEQHKKILEFIERKFIEFGREELIKR